MRTTAFITFAIACLLLSTSADARVIKKRGGLFPFGGDGGQGGNGGNGGDGGASYGTGPAGNGGAGAPGAAGGPGGATNFPLSTTTLPAIPPVPAPPGLLPAVPEGLLPTVPSTAGLFSGLPLGGQPADKRSLPVRRRLAARTGAVASESQEQSQGAADTGKKASGGLGHALGKIAIVAGSVVPGGATGLAKGGLPLGKRADV
ncbi:hypothetical protein MFLAVUS_007699 [Mucor flavus]|uniref:Uncharacterized protein n=1 Tax=Mucor flavus TaxID=439312 RepID=A0ABP9Z515_9FUNG